MWSGPTTMSPMALNRKFKSAAYLRKESKRVCRMDRQWTKKDSCGIAAGEGSAFCAFLRRAKSLRRWRCLFPTSRIVRLAVTLGERCLLRRRRWGRSGRRRRVACLRRRCRCAGQKWGNFGFRRSGRNGWRVKRREEIVRIECGLDSLRERALGAERFAENRVVRTFACERCGDQLHAPAQRSRERETFARKK